MRSTSVKVERGDSGGRVGLEDSDLVGRLGEDDGRHITVDVHLYRHFQVGRRSWSIYWQITARIEVELSEHADVV